MRQIDLVNELFCLISGLEKNSMNLRAPHAFLDLLNQHRILGWSYSARKESLPVAISWEARRQWHFQLLWNQVQLAELSEIGEQCQLAQISPILLKGFAMISDVYPDIASRYTSDIDILSSESDSQVLSQILLRRGYVLSSDDRWEGNEHKSVFSKKSPEGIEIQIEVHSSLFPPQFKSDVEWKLENHSIDGFHRLESADHLFHLMVHAIYQHNLTHLYWLIDIYEFIRHKETRIDWERFAFLVRRFELRNTYYFLDRSLQLVFGNRLELPSFTCSKYSKGFIDRFLDRTFLAYPRSRKLNYQILKHAKNSSLKDALTYDMRWFKARLALGKSGL